MTSPSTSPGPAGARFARASTLLVTNIIKLAGLAIALNELLFRANLRTSAVALSAFMMAGAQLSEQAILAALNRLMGTPTDPSTPERKP